MAWLEVGGVLCTSFSQWSRGHLQPGAGSFYFLFRGAWCLFGARPCGPSKAQARPEWRAQEGKGKATGMQGQTVATGKPHAGQPRVPWVRMGP